MKLYLLFLSFITCISQYVPVYIALKQRNIEKLHKQLLDRSNPDHVNYAQWYSKQEINSIVSPSLAEQNLVLEWIDLYDVKSKHNSGDNIKFYAKKEIVDKMFVKDSNSVYKIPQHLQDIIQFVELSSNNIEKSNRKNIKSKDILVDNRYVGRESLLNIYNYSNENLQSVSSAGVIEYQNNSGFLNSDVNTNRLLNDQSNISNISIRGVNYNTDTESELDIQLLASISNGVDLWYWNTPYWLYGFAVDFLMADNIPEVISMSWGWSESEQCSIIDCVSNNITNLAYVERVNVEYMKILLRGTTITASSGDAGAPGRTSEGCDSNRPLNPIFPGSSPWVISVGGTFVKDTNSSMNFTSKLCENNNCVEGTQEHPISYDYTDWTSGGGFSNYSNLPIWQKTAVENYLNSGIPMPNSKYFNSNGRAYPDISMVGHSCPTIENGEIEGVDGTSCSSPLFAGVVSILNSHRIKNNKPTLGFFSPLLYKMFYECENCFNDITEGYNWCTEYRCCNNTEIQYGFQSTKGFDTVSGVGTPNIGNMIDYILGL